MEINRKTRPVLRLKLSDESANCSECWRFLFQMPSVVKIGKNPTDSLVIMLSWYRFLDEKCRHFPMNVKNNFATIEFHSYEQIIQFFFAQFPFEC